MCGICGIWNQPDQDRIEAMVRSMKHRGPDDSGVFLDSRTALGMTRLAIIDTSPTGRQPMCTPDQKIWIVFNGEIFNYQEEKKLLEETGVQFSSTSDTEVVLRLYEAYGLAALQRLRGMFALAIYDKRNGASSAKLLLARDPLGIKPLLYYRRGKDLLFASELKTLLASKLVAPEINPDALRQLLTYGSVMQPNSMLKDVHMLPAGHTLVIEDDLPHIEPYWTLDPGQLSGYSGCDYPELVEMLAEGLKETVRYHMVSDVPVGAFLSGGVDSSLLVGLMAQLAGTRIKTFSVGFEKAAARLDESFEAQQMASQRSIEHTRIVVTENEVFDNFTHFISALDQPSVDGLNSYLISKAASGAVKVAVSGTGGDELFAGYPWFTKMAAYERSFEGMPYRYSMHQFAGSLLSHPALDPLFKLPVGERGRALRNRSGFLAQFAAAYRVFDPYEVRSLLAPAVRTAAGAGRSMAWEIRKNDRLRESSAINRTSALAIHGYLRNQLLRDIDAVSMAHSLEVRVPFVDVPFMKLALALPAWTRHGQGKAHRYTGQATYAESGSKKILIDAGVHLGVLREDIANQPKRGFNLPLDSWLKGMLRPFLQDCLSPSVVQKRGLFEPTEVQKVLQNFENDRCHWSHPWILMIFEMWCREMLDPV